jgi:steroid delta-isomerase-like uncharacterized protein
VSEQNIATHRRIFEEAWNKGDLDVLDEIVAPNFVNHGLNAPPGREGLKQFFAIFLAAFPDVHMTVEDALAQDDKTVIRWTATGTHQGDLMGIAPTGKAINVSGIAIDRHEEGLIAESWDAWDAQAMWQQIGAIPTPAGVVYLD